MSPILEAMQRCTVIENDAKPLADYILPRGLLMNVEEDFVLVKGPIGTGKTVEMRYLAEVSADYIYYPLYNTDEDIEKCFSKIKGNVIIDGLNLLPEDMVQAKVNLIKELKGSRKVVVCIPLLYYNTRGYRTVYVPPMDIKLERDYCVRVIQAKYPEFPLNLVDDFLAITGGNHRLISQGLRLILEYSYLNNQSVIKEEALQYLDKVDKFRKLFL